jgi:hypothetical protein
LTDDLLVIGTHFQAMRLFVMWCGLVLLLIVGTCQAQECKRKTEAKPFSSSHFLQKKKKKGAIWRDRAQTSLLQFKDRFVENSGGFKKYAEANSADAEGGKKKEKKEKEKRLNSPLI